ncbi:MAG TPA: pyruvate dehydrogenase (acetyl-transferring) E1 component subunit alpha [Chloroflexi bacterium]|nr:pyruvate dehydrogenase (acetyl-transferring) E1 component subunit alpha [Chloroflexota bacterium]
MDTQTQLELYKEMVLMRRLEERAAKLYQEGKIGGFLHLYIGQEAVASGILAARQPQDRAITAYRDHGVAIACGVEPVRVMAELLGKRDGTSRGFGGSMHMADVERNFWGGHAIVGSHLPIAAGMALADQYRGQDAVTICFFGDGATNIGYFHEALNLAAVWDLPVLWICENNQYGMGTSVGRASAIEEIHHKAEAYNTPHARVDGMDIRMVYEAAQEALAHAREKGPFFLEAVTYRFEGHSVGDPERYRTKEEIGRWEENDPIGIYRRHLLNDGAADEALLDQLEEQVDLELQEAVSQAEAGPEPAWEDFVGTIYADGYRDESWQL